LIFYSHYGEGTFAREGTSALFLKRKEGLERKGKVIYHEGGSFSCGRKIIWKRKKKSCLVKKPHSEKREKGRGL